MVTRMLIPAERECHDGSMKDIIQHGDARAAHMSFPSKRKTHQGSKVHLQSKLHRVDFARVLGCGQS